MTTWSSTRVPLPALPSSAGTLFTREQLAQLHLQTQHHLQLYNAIVSMASTAYTANNSNIPMMTSPCEVLRVSPQLGAGGPSLPLLSKPRPSISIGVSGVQQADSTTQRCLLPAPLTTPSVFKPRNPRTRPTAIIGAGKVDPAGDRRYACTAPGCTLVFKRMSHLVNHRRRHTGEKPFVCNVDNCHWRFCFADELSRHQRSHNNARPFVCNICHKSFLRSDHRKKHLSTHTSQKATLEEGLFTRAKLEPAAGTPVRPRITVPLAAHVSRKAPPSLLPVAPLLPSPTSAWRTCVNSPTSRFP